jgi:predicted aldo/keto reductase-like oxidoreductase
MSNMEQTVQNLEVAGRSGVGTLTDKEQAVIAEAQAVYAESLPVPCSKCRYCVPCPFGIDIPYNFELYNSMSAMPETAQLMKNIYAMFPPTQQASHCSECGQCEQKCPQHLPIPQSLKQVDAALRG